MTQQWAPNPARGHAGTRGEAGPTEYGRMPWIFCSPCTGLSPIIVDCPLIFFGVQIAFGLAALLLLLAIEISQ